MEKLIIYFRVIITLDLRNDMVFEDSDSKDDEDSWNFKKRI
jgi:hypothetical protein